MPLFKHLCCRSLNILEYVTMNIPIIREWVLASHHSAFDRLLQGLNFNRILVVGGGIYPRTALVMKTLYPDAQITIQDKSRESLKIAEAYLQKTNCELNISYLHEEYILLPPATTYSTTYATEYSTVYDTLPAWAFGTNVTTITTTAIAASSSRPYDLVIYPLAFQSNTTTTASTTTPIMYTRVRHCWMWENTGTSKSTIVSYLLLKKLVLEVK